MNSKDGKKHKRDKEVNAALEADGKSWVLERWDKKKCKACADLIVDALKERDR